MDILQTTSHLTPEQEEAIIGVHLDEASADVVIRGRPMRALKPDGSTLFCYVPGVFGRSEQDVVWEAMKDAAPWTENRGAAAGKLERSRTTRRRMLKKDGSLSRTTIALGRVRSGLVGFFDRYSQRWPYCRMTAYTMDHFDRFQAVLFYFQRISDLMREYCPDRWEAQRQAWERTTPEFRIPGTVFTTVTVNRNWQTACHRDAGDYKPGIGAMSVVRRGTFDGGHLVWPRYRVGVDLQSGDVVLADVHEIHCNTPLRGPAGYERLSFVLYFREKMLECGTVEEEVERARRRSYREPS